ncbi:hypothetical protein PCASD_13065 [Puccinia coronata f. sp. avenae]|uniref:Uncharacterized protein n=1 Tax=Puccinia coronata f. sp. avenae TaxID=200324 RepID=A0A2N5U4C9_9BASI|nr:hypothetical protein PCASD_13065 [Puccinia coronata f. sp. avenae]
MHSHCASELATTKDLSNTQVAARQLQAVEQVFLAVQGALATIGLVPVHEAEGHMGLMALTGSVFPAAWKCAVTAIIPKAGKDDYTDPNAYSDNNMGGECRVLADGHPDRQKGSGTKDALVLFDTWIQKKWLEKKNVARLFLDLNIFEAFLGNRLTTIRMFPGKPADNHQNGRLHVETLPN